MITYWLYNAVSAGLSEHPGLGEPDLQTFRRSLEDSDTESMVTLGKITFSHFALENNEILV